MYLLNVCKCNFFVNVGKASSTDLEELINKVRKNVFDHTGVKLELELQMCIFLKSWILLKIVIWHAEYLVKL